MIFFYRNNTKQKKMYKEKEVINAEIRTYTITTSCPRIQLPDHLSTLALKINTVKLLQFKHFSLPYVLFEACGAVFIMNSKGTFDEN